MRDELAGSPRRDVRMYGVRVFVFVSVSRRRRRRKPTVGGRNGGLVGRLRPSLDHGVPISTPRCTFGWFVLAGMEWWFCNRQVRLFHMFFLCLFFGPTGFASSRRGTLGSESLQLAGRSAFWEIFLLVWFSIGAGIKQSFGSLPLTGGIWF